MSQTPNRNQLITINHPTYKGEPEAVSGALLPWNTTYIQEPYNPLNRRLEALQQKVLEARPMIGHILQLQGQKSLFDFAKTYTRTNYNPLIEKRKDEFLTTFKEMVAELLGEEVAESATRQLKRYYNVSTAEHNGPLTHANYLSANLLSAMPLLDPIDPTLENVIVLSCANISFDNYSFPRGLLFHSYVNGEATLNQLALFPRSARPCPVIYYPGYTQESIDTAKKRLQTMTQEGTISKNVADRLTTLLNETYADPSVLARKTFTEQVTITNHLLWKKMLPSTHFNTPNMVFIEQDRIVNRLLAKHHLHADTPISRLLFDPSYHSLIEKYFDGISGAFTSETESGTFLFWALPPGAKYRTQLWLSGNELATKDGSYSIPLTPEGIAKAIANNELIPSTLLSFILLSFYYGLRLRGAFEQTTYLPQMKKAYIALLKDAGDFESIEHFSDIPTTGLTLTKPIMAFLGLPNGKRVPATALDLLLYGHEEVLLFAREAAKRITLQEATYRAYPNIYQWCYKEENRDPALSGITETDIEEIIGLSKKIVPVASLNE